MEFKSKDLDINSMNKHWQTMVTLAHLCVSKTSSETIHRYALIFAFAETFGIETKCSVYTTT